MIYIVTVNCFDITQMDQVFYNNCFSLASDERQKKAKRFRFLHDSKRCICAEMLLRYSLWESGNLKNYLEVACNKHGKPYIKNAGNFSFNISHSGKWVVIAYDHNDVGVDIEAIKESNLEQLASEFLNNKELQALNQFNDKHDTTKRLIQLWTIKESYVKYLGIGISEGITFFSINNLLEITEDSINKKVKDVKITSNLFDENYYLSICSEEKNVIVKTVEKEALLSFIYFLKKNIY